MIGMHLGPNPSRLRLWIYWGPYLSTWGRFRKWWLMRQYRHRKAGR